MKYQKPELNVVSTATKAIEGTLKPQLNVLDNQDGVTYCTPMAYEADE